VKKGEETCDWVSKQGKEMSDSGEEAIKEQRSKGARKQGSGQAGERGREGARGEAGKRASKRATRRCDQTWRGVILKLSESAGTWSLPCAPCVETVLGSL
jgi:hypothetical protein